MTYLALDPGLSHTGVAISYEGKLAVPLTVLGKKNLLQQVNQLIKEHKPQIIIIGTPSHGSTKSLAEFLKNYLQLKHKNIKFYLHNEDLTSQLAAQKLSQSIPKSHRKRKNHSAAATLILDDYLLQSR